jgi:hypothetical protein
MTGTRLGSVLSLIPGLNGGNFSASALETLDGAIYSQAYSGRNGNEPYNLGPAATRPSDAAAPDSTASFENWGSITATGSQNIYLILEGRYDATTEDDSPDPGEFTKGIWENQRSISIYKLSRNSLGTYDINTPLYQSTQTIQEGPNATRSWLSDGTPLETTYDFEDIRYTYSSNFNKLVTNQIAPGNEGSIARLYQEWDWSSEDYHGDLVVKYIDILGNTNVVHKEYLYPKIIESGAFDLRGSTTIGSDFKYTSYYLNNLVSSGSRIFYLVNQISTTNTPTEDGLGSIITSQNYRTLIFSEDISVDSSFSFTGELSFPGYTDDWNWTWFEDFRSGVVPFADGALTLVNVNTTNPDEHGYGGDKSWFTPDIYLSYLDTSNQRVLSVDLYQHIADGTLQTGSSGVFETAYEGFDLYTIGDQSFVLHKYEDAFNNGNGRFTYEIYGTYLNTDDAGITTLNLTSKAIKTIDFSYKSLGLTSKIILALQSAVSAGNVEGIQFPGGNMWSMAVFDKSKSSVVPSAFNAYMGFQKKLYDAIASAVQGTSDKDNYIVDNSAVNISEQYGRGNNDKVSASCDYELDETIELLTLTGTDNYEGTGNGKKNLITGNAGNNRLDGKDGDDTILAGLGDDVLIGGLGNDRLEGAGGSDTADYSDQTTAITVKLGDGTATGSGIGKDTLKSIENVVTGSGSDTITCASTGSNVVAGGGNDTIIFGGRRDVVEGGEGADLFRFTSAAAASRQGTTSNRIFDQITDFTFGEDRIDLPRAAQYFGYLGAISGPLISDSQLTNLWANAEQATRPGQKGFNANMLGCFEVNDSGTTRSFVAVNDGVKSYGQGDMIIEMTNFGGAASLQGALSELFVTTFI